MERRVLAAASTFALAACGPATGVSVDRDQRTVIAHTDEREVRYQFGPVGSDWEAIRIEDNDAAWRDRASGGVVHVDHSCRRDQDTPLPSLVQHLLIGFTDRQMQTEETVPFDGREARHVVVNARLDGVPMMLELYVMKKDGCVFDLGFVAPPDHFPASQPAFQSFVQGFHTITTGSPGAAANGGAT